MAQKHNIIKHLKMMGYTVIDEGGMVRTILRTSEGYTVSYTVSDEQIIYGDFIIERIVSKLNAALVSAF